MFEQGLIVRVSWLLLPAHRLKTVATVDWFVGTWEERNLGLPAAIRAYGWIELAWSGGISAGTATPVSAGVITASGCVSVRLSLRPA